MVHVSHAEKVRIVDCGLSKRRFLVHVKTISPNPVLNIFHAFKSSDAEGDSQQASAFVDDEKATFKQAGWATSLFTTRAAMADLRGFQGGPQGELHTKSVFFND